MLSLALECRASLLEHYDLGIKVACIRRKNAQSQVTDEAISHRSHSHAGCTGSTLDDLAPTNWNVVPLAGHFVAYDLFWQVIACQPRRWASHLKKHWLSVENHSIAIRLLRCACGSSAPSCMARSRPPNRDGVSLAQSGVAHVPSDSVGHYSLSR